MDAMRSQDWRAPLLGSAAMESPSDDASSGASEKLEQNAELLRIVHDLRSPLTVLVCNRRELRVRHPDELTREILDDDELALARLDSIIDALELLTRRT